MKVRKSQKYIKEKSRITAMKTEQRSCWQRVKDYMWLNNTEFFYIVCVTEHIGVFKGRPRLLILFRLFEFLALLCLLAYNCIIEDISELAVAFLSLFLSTVAVFF